MMISSQDRSCPANCPNRFPGCHNINTCEHWKIHEAFKQERYKKAAYKRDMFLSERAGYERVNREHNGIYSNMV